MRKETRFALVASCLVACVEPAPLPFELAFDPPSLRDTAVSIEARILRTACTGGQLLYQTTVRRNAPAEGTPPPVLDDGTYCFDASATDGMCMRFAAGSTTITLPREGSVVVTMVELTPPENLCPAGQFCSGGSCSDIDCAPPNADCDRRPENSCETNTNEDENHCGACGNPCYPGETCCIGVCCEDCLDPLTCAWF